NPNAPKPARPRWFELDDMTPETPPRLATWVARTEDIRSTLAASSEPLGAVEPMSRGDLDWLITIPRGGRLPFGGIAPML
ncbi:MAG: VOC family protein, partial [Deltaproteobacteria bacterium]